MAEETVIVPSAVVLPDTAAEDIDSPSQGTKRRASSASSSTSKRPRLDSVDQATSTNKPVPSRRGTADADERKRGKRLFGGLLGTLSQNSSSTAQKRRTDIERKQREKLQMQAEEDGEAKKQRLEKLNIARREQQKIWDRQALQTKHENERSRAQFLKTKSQPVLYYKPWDLLGEEVLIIEQQLKDSESKIQNELSHEQKESISTDVDMENGQGHPTNGTSQTTAPALVQDSEQPSNDSIHEAMANVANEASNEQKHTKPQNNLPTDTHKDGMDETGEDVVQGDEDAVLY